MENAGRVLLVERDWAARERMGRWLEDAGYETLACPGPSEPDYNCVASRAGRCPLAVGASVVVLDLRLEGAPAGDGTTAGELLTCYLSEGAGVVALQRIGTDPPRRDEQVVVLPWPPEQTALLKAVRSVVAGRNLGGDHHAARWSA